MLDGFYGKLKTSKWAKIAKCSTDTALRDIKDLLKKGYCNRKLVVDEAQIMNFSVTIRSKLKNCT